MSIGDKEFDSKTSDEQLIELYRGGQEAAFRQLVERYRQELFYYLARLTNNRSSADDLFQETFLQVHLSCGQFDTSRRFRPWLFTIATNKARDQLRRTRRRETVSLSAPTVGQELELVDLMEVEVLLPPEAAMQEEMYRQVREMVAELPDSLREILLLAYFHRFSYVQIAEMLGIPLGTVKSRLHTAVGTFAKKWKARFDGKE